MSRELYNQAAFIFCPKQHVAVKESNGEEKIAFHLNAHPHWTDMEIAKAIFVGRYTILDNSDYQRPVEIINPRLQALALRIAAARNKAKPVKPKRVRPTRPIKKAGR